MQSDYNLCIYHGNLFINNMDINSLYVGVFGITPKGHEKDRTTFI